MINYILQVIVFQILFLVVYDFFLSKETFFTKNRWYLLSTPVLSFLIPFIKIPTFQKAVSQEYIVYLPELVLSPEKEIVNVIKETSFYQSLTSISILFWIGVTFFSILFLIKLVKIVHLIKKNEVLKQPGFTLILIPNQTKAFSFFNYVFLGKEITKTKRVNIIEHELVHSKQKHSLDLLMFEVLKIMMWFNPMIYFYQKRITLVHEYISDAIVAKQEDKETYMNNLLSNFFQVENISFVNQFYKQTLIKKRIIMMTKNKSKKINQLKYLVLVPVLASMLLYSSCSVSPLNDISSEMKLQTIYRSSNGKLFSFKGNKETYLDSYFGEELPKEFKEISFQNLSKKEKEEFSEPYEKQITILKKYPKLKNNNGFRFFRMPNGRVSIGVAFKGLNSIHPDDIGDELLFTRLEKTPTFPGCEKGDSDCFLEKLQEHFDTNFNSNITNNLGLRPGKEKVNLEFNIDLKGNVTDLKVRASRKTIKDEVIKIMNSLPIMSHGEKYGKPIKAKYILPITFSVL